MSKFILFISLILGFSGENLGKENFQIKESIKFTYGKELEKVETQLVLKEKQENLFSLENFSLLFSIKDESAGFSFGFGNFDKSNLFFQKVKVDFSFFSSTLLNPKIKSQNFLKTPSISLSSQPIGFGIALEKNGFFCGFSCFDFATNEEFCFYNYGWEKEFPLKKSSVFLSFQNTLGYSIFLQNQSKNSWFSEKIFCPLTKMPIYVGDLYLKYEAKNFSLENGNQIRVVDSPLGGLKFSFMEELKLEIKNFSIDFGVALFPKDFPLISNNFTGNNFMIKINPQIKANNLVFGISFIGKDEPKFMKNYPYFIGDFAMFTNYNKNNFVQSLKIEMEELFAIFLMNNERMMNIKNILNPSSSTKINMSTSFNDIRFGFGCKFCTFSKMYFWENPKNQFNMEIGYIGTFGTEKKLKIDTSFKINFFENTSYSENFLIKIEYEKIKIKANLELINQFLRKNNSKNTGINFGISGTINL